MGLCLPKPDREKLPVQWFKSLESQQRGQDGVGRGDTVFPCPSSVMHCKSDKQTFVVD